MGLPQTFLNTNRKVPILDEVKWKSAVVRNDPASLSADLWFHYRVCAMSGCKKQS